LISSNNTDESDSFANEGIMRNATYHIGITRFWSSVGAEVVTLSADFLIIRLNVEADNTFKIGRGNTTE
jgi:hypothetical protein